MKKVKVAIYIRVSTKRQAEEGYSLDAQKERLEKLCETNGYIIYKVYADEGKSAKDTKRPAYQQMMEDMKAGKFDKIIVTKLDRISRSLIDLEELIQELQKNDCSFETATEKIDLDSSIGVMFVRILGIFAQFEREKITERINDTFEEMVAQCRPITGLQPFGYKNEDGKVVIDKEKEGIVKDIYNTYEKIQSQHKTYIEISDKYDLEISFNAILKILRNPIYIGKYKTNDNYTTPIISKEQFNRVQEIIKNKNVKVYKSARTFLFSGLLIDVHCNCKMAANTYKKGTTHEGVAYRCNKYRRENKCISNTVVNESFLEQYLLDNLTNEIEAYFKQIEIEYKNKNTNKVNHKKKIKNLENELERLNNVYIKKRITEEKYDEEYERIEKEIEDLKDKLKEKDTTTLHNLIKSDWAKMYTALTLENKAIFWRNIIDKIEIDPLNYRKGKEYIKIIFL